VKHSMIFMLFPVLCALLLAAQSATGGEIDAIPEEVGIFAVSHGSLTELPAETVEMGRGGLFGLEGRISKPQSVLRASQSPWFIIRAAEGSSAFEYHLLKLDAKRDYRQFRALTVRVGGARDDASKNAIVFTAEKIHERTWRIRLNLDKGEYAFFSPQVHNVGLGKSLSYTFGVDASREEPGSSRVVSAAATLPEPIDRQHTLGISGAHWEEGGVQGLQILEAPANSAAAAAGLHQGDVIAQVNSKSVASSIDLANALADFQPGTSVKIVYFIKTNLGWMPKETVARFRNEGTMCYGKGLTSVPPSNSRNT